MATYIELLGTQLEIVPMSEVGHLHARRKAKPRTPARRLKNAQRKPLSPLSIAATKQLHLALRPQAMPVLIAGGCTRTTRGQGNPRTCKTA